MWRIEIQHANDCFFVCMCAKSLCYFGDVMKFRRRSGISSSLPETSSTFRHSQAPSQQQQRSQQSLSQGLSSQHHAIFSQFSQNSQDETLTNDRVYLKAFLDLIFIFLKHGLTYFDMFSHMKCFRVLHLYLTVLLQQSLKIAGCHPFTFAVRHRLRVPPLLSFS